MDDAQRQETFIKRLNTLISLMADVALRGESASTSDKIQYLLELGLSPAEVGEVLNKPTNYITAIIHRKKKGKRKGAKNE